MGFRNTHITQISKMKDSGHHKFKQPYDTIIVITEMFG